MKKLLLILFTLVIGNKTFSQISNVQYFGGIYENTIYFNFVMHNTATCYFVVEISKDGRYFQEIFCDSVAPMPCAILHGIKIPTTDTTVCMRVSVQTKDVVLYFQQEDFAANKYTYTADVRVYKSRPVHGRF